MTFKNWLLRFDQVNLPIGDIARDVKIDKNFPKENSREAIFDYLEANHTCGPAMATFENAWDYYLAEHGPL